MEMRKDINYRNISYTAMIMKNLVKIIRTLGLKLQIQRFFNSPRSVFANAWSKGCFKFASSASITSSRNILAYELLIVLHLTTSCVLQLFLIILGELDAPFIPLYQGCRGWECEYLASRAREFRLKSEWLNASWREHEIEVYRTPLSAIYEVLQFT